ncbi:MAG: 3'(2'),5'-bisphosphate nucleotidase CysQ family protein [Luteibaculaceae bacterium]
MFNLPQNILPVAIEAALEASKIIKKYYHHLQELTIEHKSNNTPVTIVDSKAEIVIRSILKQTNIPVIGEEQESAPYHTRKSWEYAWIVDPLDGTREFLNRTGEFCVSIALCKKGEPILGILAAPEIPFIAFGGAQMGSAMILNDNYLDLSAEQIIEQAKPLIKEKEVTDFTLLVSRSMFDEQTATMVNQLKEQNKNLKIKHLGSAIKFIEIINGKASAYFRPGPSFEWDTAGGHAIVKHFGLEVKKIDDDTPLEYNKENLKNPYFYCSTVKLPI